ncbi:MAG: hypothetical protein QM669_05800 [Siphonobacter sp.]
MTLIRKGTFIRKAKDITIGSTLTMAVLTGSVVIQSCGSSNETEYETREETSFSKGVRTYITEVEPGQFKITDEVSVPADSSRAIVRYYDGHRDTLTAQAAKALIDREVINNPHYVQGHHGLGSALLWGGMGYFLANSLQNRQYQQYYDRERNRASYYSNAGIYTRANQVQDEVRSSRTTRTIRTSRPSKGRSGFFSRMSSRGFGG